MFLLSPKRAPAYSSVVNTLVSLNFSRTIGTCDEKLLFCRHQNLNFCNYYYSFFHMNCSWILYNKCYNFMLLKYGKNFKWLFYLFLRHYWSLFGYEMFVFFSFYYQNPFLFAFLSIQSQNSIKITCSINTNMYFSLRFTLQERSSTKTEHLRC